MRTKNAVSNIFIPLRELKKVFQDDALILVNKKFLEANGLSKKDKEEKLVDQEMESIEIQEVK